MAPETEPLSFTYFNGRMTPSFKPRNLSLLKLGLRWIAGAPEHRISEPEKTLIFSHLADSFSNSLRAVYGQSGERGTSIHSAITNMVNTRHDITRGFPLLDHISKYSFEDWAPTFQETDLNPGVAQLFGFPADSRSITHSMATMPLMPSFAAELTKASYMHYMPVGYIPEFVSTANYGAINGVQGYRKALDRGFQIMLGNVNHLNLMYKGPKAPHKAAYDKLQPEETKNKDWLKDINQSKDNWSDC